MTMTRLTFSLFAFVAVAFLFVSPVSAQGTGLIREDHQNYTKSFSLGKEPDLSPEGYDTWRRKYSNHRWSDYAKGGEFRDPLLEAQTLMGIYLISHVDHHVALQIDNIIVSKAALGTALSERMTLEMIGSYLDSTGSGSGTSTAGGANAAGGSSPSESSDSGGAGGRGSTGRGSTGRGGTGGGSTTGGGSSGGGLGGGTSGGSTNSSAGGAGGFYSDLEIDRMEMLNRNIDVSLRKRIVSPVNISAARMGEIRSIRNMFQTHKKDWDAKDWESKYYHMRERFDLLNDLAAYFPFNWTDETKREEVLEKLMEDEKFKRAVEREVEEEISARQMGAMSGGSMGMSDMYGGSPMGMGMSPYGGQSMGMGMGMSPYGGPSMGMSPPMMSPSDSDGSPYDSGGGFDGGGMGMMGGGMTMEEIQAFNKAQLEEQIAKRIPDKADEVVQQVEARYKAFKYIVGVYQSSDYYVETLQTIHRYYLDAADAGDPIAQYHLALFLLYLGDIVDPHEYPNPDACKSASMKWLNKARESNSAKNRVKDLEELFAAAATKQARRDEEYIKKYLTLVRVEDDKIDIFENVLIGIRDRIGGISGTTSADDTKRMLEYVRQYRNLMIGQVQELISSDGDSTRGINRVRERMQGRN